MVCFIHIYVKFSLKKNSISDVDQRQNVRYNQREQRTHVEHDLEKEKHTLRLMKGLIKKIVFFVLFF
jgi:hypothetical protein